jgi:DinB family protein
MNVATDQPTTRELLARMDEAWASFSRGVHALPTEVLEQKLGEREWSRKQMLAHIAMWHDLTAERLAGFGETGEPVAHDEDDDVTNARAARGAEGRTTGEVLLAMDESYRRLRREVSRLSNDQVAAHDAWAARAIAGNTYGHYDDHRADLDARPR